MTKHSNHFCSARYLKIPNHVLHSFISLFIMSNADGTALLSSSSAITNTTQYPSTTLDHTFPLSDPWRDDDVSSTNTTNQSTQHELKTPDFELLDQTVTASIVDTLPQKPESVSKDVLSEFDPLATSDEEKAAQEAWRTAESHPPPPRSPTPPPSPPVKASDSGSDSLLASATSSPTQLPISPSQSTTFPSLAALARTFSIPSFSSKSRPQSWDVAKNVPSPNTLSEFASQQGEPPGASKPPTRSNTPSGAKRSTTASPVPGGPSNASSSNGNEIRSSEGQFDFQKFLDQMKSKPAEPVNKYLRSFLGNFAKRPFTVNDQIKVINDFLAFIADYMRNCDVWKNIPDAEFDNAMEGMEKLVMNRLYDFTFTPQLARAIPPRPITTDDLERDRVLSQRIALFGWLGEKHLDIPTGEGSQGFLMFAQQELVKINHYKAPRDKLICILNCCKVIFGLLRHLKKEEGADAFVPILIFVVLKANPEHLLSNVEFISRFRNPTKLQSEAGYYLNSLMGAVSFIETMDHSSLSCITQEEFEAKVEEAIQNLPQSEPQSPELSRRALPSFQSQLESAQSPHAGEESAQPLSITTPSINSPVQTLSEDAKRFIQKTGDTISKPLNAISRIFNEALDGAENKLSYLPGPFAPFELGREQRSENQSGQPQWGSNEQYIQQRAGSNMLPPHTPNVTVENGYVPPMQTPYRPRVRRVPSPSYPGLPSGGSPGYGGLDDTPTRKGPYTNQPLAMGPPQYHYFNQGPSELYAPGQQALLPPRVQSLAAGGDGYLGGDGAHISRTPTPNLDIAGVQAEIDNAHEHAARASKETLRQIFPSVDIEVVEWVLEAKEGDLGKSIEALLEMSSET